MESTIYQTLYEKRQQVLSQWQSAAFDAYGGNIALLRNKPEGRFSNPVVYLIEKATGEIFDLLIKPENDQILTVSVNEICHLMAIQGSKPSRAISFIFALKQIIREELKDENGANYWAAEMVEIDKIIDEIGLLAFDIYSDCRAEICDLKVSEIKRMYGRDAG